MSNNLVTRFLRFQIVCLLLFLAFTNIAFAAATVNPGITYTGRILKADGVTPVVSTGVTFSVAIYDVNHSCLMFTETRTLDLSASGGTFSFDIGDGSGAASYKGNVLDIYDLFNNAKTFSGMTCAVGTGFIAAATTEPRVLMISFDAGDGNGAQTLPALKINPVPLAGQAYNAMKLGGYGSGDLLRVAPAVDKTANANTDLTQAQYDELWRLVKNPGTAYLTTAPGGGLSTTLTSANIYVGNASNVATAVTMSGDATMTNAGVVALSTTGVTAGTYTKITVDAKGRATVGANLSSSDITTALGFTPANSAAGLPPLTSANIFIGNASNIAEAHAMSGDATISNTGVVTVDKTTTAAANKILALDGSSVANVKGVSVATGTGSLALLSAGTTTNYSLTFPATAPGSNNMVPLVSTAGVITWGTVGLSTTLTSANFYVGNASNVATAVTMSGDATMTNAGVVTLATSGVTAGTYTKITVDDKGRATVGAALSSSDVTTALGFTPSNNSTAFIDGGNSFAQAADIGTNDNYVLNFRTNNTTKATILANGNFGVGDANPSANKFVVSDDNASGAGTAKLQNVNAGVSATVGLELFNDTGTKGSVYVGSNAYSADGKNRVNVDGTSAGVSIKASNAAGTINFYSGGINLNGTFTAAGNLELTNQIKIAGGTPGAGKVLTSDAAGLASWQTAGSGWGLSGNSGTTAGTNFIGTTDDKNFVVKRNNVQAALLDKNYENTSWGVGALNPSATGPYNIAFGNGSLAALTSGVQNTSVGFNSQNANTTANDNTSVGMNTLVISTSGAENTAVGRSAVMLNTTGSENVGIGKNALMNSNGSKNAAVGTGALYGVTSGNRNIGFGYYAGSAITSGSNNVVIGANDGTDIATSSNNIMISDGTGNLRVWIDPTGNTGIGTTVAPTAKLEVAGQVKITGGTPGLNKVLTSDAAGLASWQNAAASGLSTTLTSANFYLGNASNVATAVTMSGDATMTNAGVVTLATTGVTAGTYTKVTIDAKGRAIAGASLASSDVTTALGFTPSNAASSLSTALTSAYFYLGNASNVATAVTMSGDATMSNAGVVTVDKSTAAANNKILQLNGSGVANIKGLSLQTGTGSVALQSAGTTANYSLTFPAAAPGATQMLQSDASGILTWVTSGVSSQWTTTGSDIYYTTGKVGIGTNAPSQALHVEKNQNGSTEILVKNTSAGANAESQVYFNNDLGIIGSVGSASSGYLYGYASRMSVWAGANSTGVALTTESPTGTILFSTGGAPQTNERMRITSAGKVGIGTSSPAGNLSVVGNMDLGSSNTLGANGVLTAGRSNNVSGQDAIGGGYSNTVSGDQAVALGQSNTASNTGSVALGRSNTSSGLGAAAFGNATTAASHSSFTLGRYNVGGGSAGSWVATDPLFEIGIGASAGAPANAVTVLKSGNVGIGVSAPAGKLEISTAGANQNAITATSASGNGIYATSTSNSAIYGAVNNSSSAVIGDNAGAGWGVLCNRGMCGGSVAWTNFSDRRLKEKIVTLPETRGLDAIRRLRPVTYHWKDKDKDKYQGQRLGFIAQEVEAIYPEVTSTDPNTGMKSLSYAELTSPIVKSIQELDNKCEMSKEQLGRLDRRMASLEESNADLKKRLEKSEQEAALLKKYLCAKDPKAEFCH